MRKKVDYTGKRNGLLTVVAWDDKKQKWRCCCDCGNTIYYTSKQLRSNKPRSCGCLKSPDIIGKKYGRLEVIDKTDNNDSNGNRYYLCKCDCGNTKFVTAHNLNNGLVKSCGCLAAESSNKIGKEIGKKVADKCIAAAGTNPDNFNAGIPSHNTSGAKGVTWDKQRQKWAAQICVRQKRYNLGRYDNINDAIEARKRAEKELIGEDKPKLYGLKKLRVERGFTQKKLAKLAKVPLRTLQDWESGRRNPRPENLESVASVLELSVETIISELNKSNISNFDIL